MRMLPVANRRLWNPMLWALAATLLWGAVVMFAGPEKDLDLPGLFENSAVALQAAPSLEEVATIVGIPGGPNWRAIRLQTIFDFFLAASYAWAFVVMGGRLRKRGDRASSLLGTTVLVCGIAAGAFDWCENVAILRCVNDPISFCAWVSRFAALKWTTLGVAALAAIRLWFPPLPLDDERKAFGAFAAFLYANAGTLALAGIFWPLAWERFGLPFALALLVSAGLALRSPRDLVV